MKFEAYKRLAFSDLNRTGVKPSFYTLLKALIFGESYKYIFWFRTCCYTKKPTYFRFTLYPIAIIMLSRYKYKFGVDIPLMTEVGEGLYIGHFGGIFINSQVVIGKNCNLSQGVSIGQSSRGANKGCATIGDNVYIGPGAKIVGRVTIGNNVAIGANCVVTKSAPDNSVVVGVPGRIISDHGSAGYICDT